MREPGFLFFVGLIVVCLFLVVAGVFLVARFNTLFKTSIRNEWLRRNAVVWLIIFCFSGALFPLGGGLLLIVNKYGWWGLLLGQIASTTVTTLVAYNATRYVIDHPRIKRLSFIKNKLIIVLVVTLLSLLVNLPFAFLIYQDKLREYIKYTYISSIYFGAVTGLIYALVSYLDLEKKKKFDEKELELSRLRELKTKAELDSKINPHFLYNALNSIADLAVTDGRKGRKMTIALAELFRYSINYSDNNYSTVKDELAMAEVYLQIEKIRFEDQLNYSIHAEEGISYYLLPRFLLQPLVENAVKHGLKATGQMTEISIEVKMEGEGLTVIVADNGPAFPQNITPGYGVKSVFDKLELLFPEQYQVQFINAPRKQVSIHIKRLMK
jgi:sensor histidine kinase YesM